MDNMGVVLINQPIYIFKYNILVLRPANNLTLTGSSSIHYSPRNSMENDAWTLGESSEFGDDYDENDEIDDHHHHH
ncbi:uncharacterized protein Dwil_GK28312, partial [Drosophila willistoni]